MTPLPCGPKCVKFDEPDLNGATEYHDLVGAPSCEAHVGCIVHGNFHYRMPVPNGIITELKAPA